ncbi:SDR family oxidoreductase [Polynucleobacter sp. UK-Gri1-W3]|uniref:dTDP-4-dehydrorhamnose reductase family protein n=1 Tax=Polynucleobacter sp. UK-Gri1-W3 TaxID=1819737 RepID=UPI001C0CFD63|nr:SDR family oxidoreductase [Polynucleobacter sp. UK-Gri1-W3]MBU3538254.1 SDR family oxidoreductase [Polynucleobacter sp. UK-Gri1-W3]
MKILIFGAGGLIGSNFCKIISENNKYTVIGVSRPELSRMDFFKDLPVTLESGINLLSTDSVIEILIKHQPDVVINCAGLTKHKAEAENPLIAIPINGLIPHRLANLCKLADAKFIQISSDCVFSGTRGFYCEDDTPDASDVYGKSKALGEVLSGNALTLRTSTIGHEINTKYGLLEWFLVQKNRCNGYRQAIFSGLPTVELGRVVRDFILPNLNLSGLYHVAAKPIDKYSLLKLIADEYKKPIDIIMDDDFKIDRSLNSLKFQLATGYVPPSWPDLITSMHECK